jgi:hypothetical protein
MFAALRRHPFAVRAHFRHSLVLTFAYPRELLQPLLPPGLVVDEHDGCGFVAIALVATERLRPALLPAWCGRDFFLVGYRIFSRFRRADGRALRGLRILRSDTDRRFMVWSGNLFTGYRYRFCRCRSERTAAQFVCRVTSGDGAGDLDVRIDLATPVTAPPAGSPFGDLATARRFAGPLPFTFGYEPATRSMVVVQGEREDWQPRPVRVEHVHSTFLQQPPFADAPLRLANAFLVENVPYRWRRGVVERVPEVAE